MLRGQSGDSVGRHVSQPLDQVGRLVDAQCGGLLEHVGISARLRGTISEDQEAGLEACRLKKKRRSGYL